MLMSVVCMRAIFEFLVLQQLGTMLKSRPVLSLEAIRLSVVCAAATTSTILVYLTRAALKAMLLQKAMMLSVICTPAECKGQGSYLCSGIHVRRLTVEKQRQPLPTPHHPKVTA